MNYIDTDSVVVSIIGCGPLDQGWNPTTANLYIPFRTFTYEHILTFTHLYIHTFAHSQTLLFAQLHIYIFTH